MKQILGVIETRVLRMLVGAAEAVFSAGSARFQGGGMGSDETNGGERPNPSPNPASKRRAFPEKAGGE